MSAVPQGGSHSEENASGLQKRDGERSRPRRRLAWAETTTLAAVTAGLGGWLRPEDPFFLKGPFSWPCLTVALAALLHGGMHGLGCLLMLGAGLAVARSLGLVALQGIPWEHCFGLLVMAVVVGEFREMWARRLQQTEHQRNEWRARLDRCSRAQSLLRASHERLEQRLAGGAPSLREALTTLQKQLLPLPAGESPLAAIGERFLGLMASYSGALAAALHAVGDNNQLEPEPVARLGERRVSLEEPLVREALRVRRTVSARSFAGGEADGEALVAIPLVDAREHTWGLVVISDMQFIAFHEGTLRLLSSMGAWMADALADSATRTWQFDSDVLSEIESRLLGAQRDGAPVGVVAVRVDQAWSEGEQEPLASLGRVVDRMWRIRGRDGALTVMFLLAMAGEAGLEEFRARLQAVRPPPRRARAGQNRLALHSWPMQPGDSVESLLCQLRRFCETDGVEGETSTPSLPGAAELGVSVLG